MFKYLDILLGFVLGKLPLQQKVHDGLTSLSDSKLITVVASNSSENATLYGDISHTRLSVRDGARLALQDNFSKFLIRHLLSGDGTGWLHVLDGQTVVLGNGRREKTYNIITSQSTWFLLLQALLVKLSRMNKAIKSFYMDLKVVSFEPT